MLRIFGRTTLVSQFMVRSEMRLTHQLGYMAAQAEPNKPGLTPIPRNCGLFRSLFRSPHTLRQGGHQIGNGADGSRGRAPLGVEAGAERIDQRGADYGTIGILRN